MSISRLARAFAEPRSTVGRWVRPAGPDEEAKKRRCPVSGDPEIIAKVRGLCLIDRHRTYGHRRIHALLKHRSGVHINRKTVLKIMREAGLTQPKIWRRPQRPKRVAKMKPERSNQAWRNSWDRFWEAHEAIDNYIKFYNEDRIHSALGYITPAQAAANEATLKAA